MDESSAAAAAARLSSSACVRCCCCSSYHFWRARRRRRRRKPLCFVADDFGNNDNTTEHFGHKAVAFRAPFFPKKCPAPNESQLSDDDDDGDYDYDDETEASVLATLLWPSGHNKYRKRVTGSEPTTTSSDSDDAKDVCQRTGDEPLLMTSSAAPTIATKAGNKVVVRATTTQLEHKIGPTIATQRHRSDAIEAQSCDTDSELGNSRLGKGTSKMNASEALFGRTFGSGARPATGSWRRQRESCARERTSYFRAIVLLLWLAALVASQPIVVMEAAASQLDVDQPQTQQQPTTTKLTNTVRINGTDNLAVVAAVLCNSLAECVALDTNSSSSSNAQTISSHNHSNALIAFIETPFGLGASDRASSNNLSSVARLAPPPSLAPHSALRAHQLTGNAPVNAHAMLRYAAAKAAAAAKAIKQSQAQLIDTFPSQSSPTSGSKLNKDSDAKVTTTTTTNEILDDTFSANANNYLNNERTQTTLTNLVPLRELKLSLRETFSSKNETSNTTTKHPTTEEEIFAERVAQMLIDIEQDNIQSLSMRNLSIEFEQWSELYALLAIPMRSHLYQLDLAHNNLVKLGVTFTGYIEHQLIARSGRWPFDSTAPTSTLTSAAATTATQAALPVQANPNNANNESATSLFSQDTIMNQSKAATSIQRMHPLLGNGNLFKRVLAKLQGRRGNTAAPSNQIDGQVNNSTQVFTLDSLALDAGALNSSLHRPSLIRALDISNNKLKWLLNDQFRALKHVQTIRLDHNKIRYIHQQAFNGLESLRFLNLNFNRLQVIYVEQFQSNYNLLSLSLRNNMLAYLRGGSFASQNSLKRLDLSQNKFTILSNNAFVGLESLRYLNLSSNQFIHVPSNSFHPLVSVRQLDLSANQLTQLAPGTFFHLPLEELWLERNQQLVAIDRGAFWDLTNLRKVWLNSNPMLMSINTQAFVGTPNLHLINSDECNQLDAQTKQMLENITIATTSRRLMQQMESGSSSSSSLQPTLISSGDASDTTNRSMGLMLNAPTQQTDANQSAQELVGLSASSTNASSPIMSNQTIIALAAALNGQTNHLAAHMGRVRLNAIALDPLTAATQSTSTTTFATGPQSASNWKYLYGFSALVLVVVALKLVLDHTKTSNYLLASPRHSPQQQQQQQQPQRRKQRRTRRNHRVYGLGDEIASVTSEFASSPTSSLQTQPNDTAADCNGSESMTQSDEYTNTANDNTNNSTELDDGGAANSAPMLRAHLATSSASLDSLNFAGNGYCDDDGDDRFNNAAHSIEILSSAGAEPPDESRKRINHNHSHRSSFSIKRALRCARRVHSMSTTQTSKSKQQQQQQLLRYNTYKRRTHSTDTLFEMRPLANPLQLSSQLNSCGGDGNVSGSDNNSIEPLHMHGAEAFENSNEHDGLAAADATSMIGPLASALASLSAMDLFAGGPNGSDLYQQQQIESNQVHCSDAQEHQICMCGQGAGEPNSEIAIMSPEQPQQSDRLAGTGANSGININIGDGANANPNANNIEQAAAAAANNNIQQQQQVEQLLQSQLFAAAAGCFDGFNHANCAHFYQSLGPVLQFADLTANLSHGHYY